MLVGLIGHPVAHSLSPVMQNAAFAASGLANWTYELWDTSLEDLPQRMQMIRKRDDIAGCNVTIPHKQNVMPYLDEISEHARAIGAVNTLCRISPSPPSPPSLGEGGLVGDNTDWIGFLNDLRWHSIDVSSLRHALVLGAGGSARAVVYALVMSSANVGILNRNLERAEQLAESMRARVVGLGGPEDLRGLEAALIVNCTSAGMWPNDDTSPWPADVPFPKDAVLYDLVYRPRVTKLMRQAEAAGLRVIGGIGMLVEQGAAAFETWTGVPAQRVASVMRTALQAGNA